MTATSTLDPQRGIKPMPPAVQRLLAQTAEGAAPRLSVQTGTRVDVGHWLGKRSVWLIVCERQSEAGDPEPSMALIAPGRRPLAAELSAAQVAGSIYNPVAGALVLAPVRDLPVSSLRMASLTARQVLGYFKDLRDRKESDHA